MLANCWSIFRIVCCIAAISGCLLKFFSATKIAKKVSNFFKKHRIIAAIYIIMVAIGLFSAVFSVAVRV